MSSSTDNLAIAVSGLDYRYPGAGQPALTGIELRVPRASTFGLLGPNGAGKSTLLSLLIGLRRAQRGRIEIAGFDSIAGAARIRALSALVPQDYAFYPSLTGRENLRFFAGLHGLDERRWRQRLDYCVAACRLEDVLDRRSEHYSGGVKRRLNLAIGLLNAPQILYLDEPTVGIDALSRQCILDAIRALKAEGVTIVYTSHYMEEVEAICDALAVIDSGRVVLQGDTQQLLREEAARQLQLQLEAEPDAALLAALAPYAPVAIGRRLELQLAAGSTQLPELLALLARHGAVVEQLHFGASRLEQVYLALLARGTAA